MPKTILSSLLNHINDVACSDQVCGCVVSVDGGGMSGEVVQVARDVMILAGSIRLPRVRCINAVRRLAP